MSILPVVVILAAIFSFFLDEFTRLFKKIFEKKWAQIVIPLLLASALMMSYSHFILSFLLTIQSGFRYLMWILYEALPFKVWAGFFAQFVIIFLVATLPTACLYGFLTYKKSIKKNHWTFCTYFFLWIISILLWAA